MKVQVEDGGRIDLIAETPDDRRTLGRVTRELSGSTAVSGELYRQAGTFTIRLCVQHNDADGMKSLTFGRVGDAVHALPLVIDGPS